MKKGYIGDNNGQTKLFYFSGYVWKKYNAIDNSYYELEESYRPATWKHVGGISSCGIWNKRPTIDEKTGEVNSPNYYSSGKGIYQNSLKRIWAELDFDSFYYINDTSYLKPGTVSGNKYWIQYDTKLDKRYVKSYSQGSYITDVESDNSNAFPDNGYKDGYWYVKQVV